MSQIGRASAGPCRCLVASYAIGATPGGMALRLCFAAEDRDVALKLATFAYLEIGIGNRATH